MRVVFVSVFLVVVLVWAPLEARAGRFLPHRSHLTVEQKVAYFKRSLRHERQVVAWLESRFAPRTLERHSALRWYQNVIRWHTHLLAQYRWKLQPDPRTFAGPCLAAVIDHEGSSWNPRKWNGGTVATAYERGPTYGSGAYGLPQALPASKMASAGTDWATNPYTQIRWAHMYAVQRYGSDCGAWAHWQAARQW